MRFFIYVDARVTVPCCPPLAQSLRSVLKTNQDAYPGSYTYSIIRF